MHAHTYTHTHTNVHTLQSCPAIQVYSGSNLERALTSAAENFCAQEVVVGEKNVVMSKIFHWYASDFGDTKKELLQ